MAFGLTIGTERANTLQVRQSAQFFAQSFQLTTILP